MARDLPISVPRYDGKVARPELIRASRLQTMHANVVEQGIFLPRRTRPRDDPDLIEPSGAEFRRRRQTV